MIAHVTDITLTDVEFHAQDKCMERARLDLSRQVCAYAIGRGGGPKGDGLYP